MFGPDAKLHLALKVEDIPTLSTPNLGEALEDLLVVSEVAVVPGEDLAITVEPHPGTKCPRCWNHKGGAGQGEDADLCPRCWAVVQAERA